MVSKTARYVQSEIKITQADPNVTAGTPAATKMEMLWQYKVPRQTELKIRPQDTLGLYLKDAGAESADTDTWQMLIKDPNGIVQELIAGPSLYKEGKEFQDSNLKYRIGGLFYVPSDFIIEIQVKCAVIVVPASCYFRLTARRRARVG